MHKRTHERRPSSGTTSTKKITPPIREDIEARRDRLLDALKLAVPAMSRSVVLDGQECKILDAAALADEYGFHPLQILNDLRDLSDLGLIDFGHAMLPTGRSGRYEPAWVVRLV